MSSLKDLHFLSDVCDGAWFSFLHIKEDEDKEKGINFFLKKIKYDENKKAMEIN